MTDSALVGFEPGRLAAQIAIAGAVIAVLALAALIFVRADLNPSQHMISEYAIGGHGWIITVAFFGFAIASAGLLVALTGVVQGPLGWLGLLCLLAAAPVAIAGFFHYNGMTLEQFLWAFIKSEILCAGPRRFDSVNLHEEMFADIMEGTLE